ncbi:outer membrane lipoprotein-sorting protein [Leptothrix sp. C29]|uniref:Outer membrane lipoprotein-sorting protein n=2 Tax=Sphaerotilus uruguayifluvii TaxID=2735897 RepID=A0ABX2G6J3_9BURK|nr:outer membrane lipoprotein-sorting protein [Leptothrix sp. C29]
MQPMRTTPTAPLTGRRRLMAALALLLVLPTGGPAHAAGFDLDALMARLTQVRAGEATFVERREVFQNERGSPLALESSGRLSFAAPDTFVRETLKPRQERLAVQGNQLTMSQGGRSRTTTLDSVPEAVVIVEAIRGTLTGNRELLERLFVPRLSGEAARWTLELVPRDARLRGQVAQLRILGAQAQLREVQMTMSDGDRTQLRIEPVAP